MPDSQQTSLTFSLEESVWFKKGQEVDELISISLDPHITITEADDYVVLKGSLELTGEYRPCGNGEAAEEFPEAGKRYIQTVEWRNDEESLFSHHFPVDITIPRRRIEDMDQVDVQIQSFDCHMPELACLKLVADVDVLGVRQETAEPAADLPEAEAMDHEEERETEEQKAETGEQQTEIMESLVNEELAAESSCEDQLAREDSQLEEPAELTPAGQEEDLYEPFAAEARITPEPSEKDKKLSFAKAFPALPEMVLEALQQSMAKHDSFFYPEREAESSSHVPQAESSPHEDGLLEMESE